MTTRIPHVLRYVQEHPWAILPTTLQAIVEVLDLHAAGGRFTAEEIAARIGAAAAPAPQPAGGAVAVLPLFGVVSQRMGMMEDISGGTSIEKFTQAFRQAIADPSVEAIVLQIDSPGGSVYGVAELATEIHEARDVKPIVAVADSLAASAAYWIGSQAREFVVTPGGQVGSIGVISLHWDLSKAYDEAGMKPTLIRAGEFKGEGNQYQPLSEEDHAAMQETVDQYYALFTKAVAAGRGRTVAEVRDGFGRGRVMTARDALAAGMVDRIDTMTSTMTRLASKRTRNAMMNRPADAAANTDQDPARDTSQDSSSAWRDRIDAAILELE